MKKKVVKVVDFVMIHINDIIYNFLIDWADSTVLTLKTLDSGAMHSFRIVYLNQNQMLDSFKTKGNNGEFGIFPGTRVRLIMY